MEIQLGNKLIAEFDGKSLVSFVDKHSNAVFEGWVWEENGRSKQANNLQYHSSWDWLMPVVEKIEKLNATKEKYYEFQIYRAYVEVSSYDFTDTTFSKTLILSEGHGSKLLNVWNACIDFIQWFNQSSLSSSNEVK